MLKMLVFFAVVAAIVWWIAQQRTADPVRELVAMCRGDEQHARRLIAAEKSRKPGISDHQAARRAVLSWRRDLR
jgi:hypothetical protein